MNVFKVGEETHILDGYNEDCTVFEVDEAGLNNFLLLQLADRRRNAGF